MGFHNMKIMHLAALAGLGSLVAGCAHPQGRVVSPEWLSGFEGGGSLSTLWYYGSDGRYHHFRHLWKTVTPYRVKQDGFEWRAGTVEPGESNGVLVRRELSDHVLRARGITISDKTPRSAVFGILAARGGKEAAVTWEVGTRDGFVRILKSRTDGVLFAPGCAVEVWGVDGKGNWVALPGA